MSKLIKILLIFFVFLLLFIGFFHSITAITQDLGRHLITGQIILETRQVPKVNLFSYTYPDFPFINHHWFSEVIFYTIFQLTGFSGLLILTTITVMSSFSFMFFFAYKRINSLVKNDGIIPLAAASVLYMKVLFERTDVRPEIFSFLFLSAFITILYKNRKKFTRWIFILPLIELMWVNTHIYFPIGLAVVGLFLIDGIIKNRKNIFCDYIGILAVTLILSSFVTLLNPNFINGALYPFRVFNNYGYAIEENQNIIFLWQLFEKPTVPFFAALSLLLFLSLIINLKRSLPIDWFLSLFFTLLGIIAVRNFPLFVFGTFIPLAINFSFIFEKILHGIHPLPRLNLLKSVLSVTLLSVIIWQTMHIATVRKIGFEVEKGAQNAADFFLANNLKGPVFNNFDIGSYLDYRFYKNEKVFVDGRPEAYPATFFQKIYIPMQEDKDFFDKKSQEYKFNTIFFSHTDQTPWAGVFLRQIVNNKNWKIIYFDDYVIILIKNNEQNKKIAEKFAFDKISSEKLYQTKDLNTLFRLATFFNRVGWTEQETEIYKNILSINPNSCPALYGLAIAPSQNQTIISVYVNRFKQNCK